MASNKKHEKEVVEEPKMVKNVVETKSEIKVLYPCPRCGSAMRITGAGKSGKDFHCDKCGLNNTRMI